MRFIKVFINCIPMLVAMLPLFGIIFLVFIIIYMIKNKVKIKLRTFKGKGFRPVRGNFGLYCYCGKQGKGKTYSLVEYLIDNSKKIQVFSNITDISNVDCITYFTGFKEMLELRDKLDWAHNNRQDWIIFHNKRLDLYDKQIVFVYDEVFTEIIKGTKLSKSVMDFLCQMRKRKIIFLTTCQEWAELPLPFRRFCRFQIDCDMKPFLWTGLLIKTFKDAENMKWDNDEQEHVAPIVETTITKCRRYIADSYDTFLRISSVAPPETGASATPPVEEGSSTDLSKFANGIPERSEDMPDCILTNQ